MVILALQDDVKVALRIKNNSFDESEIKPLMLAAQRDMERVGIVFNNVDPLCQRAVTLYCKGNFGYSKDGEKFQLAYERLRDSMSLSGLYNGSECDV